MGKPLENYVTFVFDFILNHKSDGIAVSKNTYFVGKSGARHEVDVYYEFRKAGILHRVAIECKDTVKPVEKGRVQEFHGKLRDIGWDIAGIMISKSGYQSGAQTFAAHHDIKTLTEEELPNLFSLLTDRIRTRVMPSEDYVGEPFWALFAVDAAGELTGSYLGAPQQGPNGERCVWLFIAKSHADSVLKKLNSNGWVVRGLPQFFLASFIQMTQNDSVGYLISLADPDDPSKNVVAFFYKREDLNKEFLLPRFQNSKGLYDRDDGWRGMANDE
ncbi:MAG: restriction endonuclease [Candidatus Omnitrophota bacterium]